MDSNSPRNPNILPTSLLSGMLVIRARRAGSMLALKAPTKVVMITTHHKDGPVMKIDIMFQRAMDTNPKIATV
jgi:hypothetical protein